MSFIKSVRSQAFGIVLLFVLASAESTEDPDPLRHPDFIHPLIGKTYVFTYNENCKQYGLDMGQRVTQGRVRKSSGSSQVSAEIVVLNRDAEDTYACSLTLSEIFGSIQDQEYDGQKESGLDLGSKAYFRWRSNGQVGELLLDASENPWAANAKRGFLSALQVTLASGSYSADEDSISGQVRAQYQATWNEHFNQVSLSKTVTRTVATRALGKCYFGEQGRTLRYSLSSGSDGSLIPRTVSSSARYSVKPTAAPGLQDGGFDCRTEIRWQGMRNLPANDYESEHAAYLRLAEEGYSPGQSSVARRKFFSSAQVQWKLSSLELQEETRVVNRNLRTGRRAEPPTRAPDVPSALVGNLASGFMALLRSFNSQDAQESLRIFVELGEAIEAEPLLAILLSRHIQAGTPSLTSKLFAADVLASSAADEVLLELLRPLFDPNARSDSALVAGLLLRVSSLKEPAPVFLSQLEAASVFDDRILLTFTHLLHRKPSASSTDSDRTYGPEENAEERRSSEGSVAHSDQSLAALQELRARFRGRLQGSDGRRHLRALAAVAGVDALLPLLAADTADRTRGWAYRALEWAPREVSAAQGRALAQLLHQEPVAAQRRRGLAFLAQSGWRGVQRFQYLSDHAFEPRSCGGGLQAPSADVDGNRIDIDIGCFPHLPPHAEVDGVASVLDKLFDEIHFEEISLGSCKEDVNLLSHSLAPFWSLSVKADLCNTVEASKPVFGAFEFDVKVKNGAKINVNLFGMNIDVLDVGTDVRYATPKYRADDHAADLLQMLDEEEALGQAVRDSRGVSCTALQEPQDCCHRWAACEQCAASNSSWASSLPSCPCTLQEVCWVQSWCSCDHAFLDLDCRWAQQCFSTRRCAQEWYEDVELLGQWGKAQHGAAVCLAKSVQGHAQRCCYDADNKLITHGPGAASPVRVDPREDYPKYHHWEYLAAVDCGLHGVLDPLHLQSRPPASLACPPNAPSDAPAQSAPPSTQRDLGKCALQDAACDAFCETGGVAAPQCPAAEAAASLFFDGAYLGLVWRGASAFAFVWDARSGDRGSRPEHQHGPGGPIPEGRWWLAPSSDASGRIELFPCCGTQLRERSACLSRSSESAALPCRARFALSSDPHQGGIKVEESTLAALKGVDGVLLVHYGRSIVQQDLQDLSAANLRFKLLGLPVDLNFLSTTKKMRKDYRQWSKSKKEHQRRQSGKSFCQDGPFMLKDCTKDADCASRKVSSMAKDLAASIKRLTSSGEKSEVSNHTRGIKEHTCGMGTGFKRALFDSQLTDKRSKDWDSSTSFVNMFHPFNDGDDPGVTYYKPPFCEILCEYGLPMIALELRVRCGARGKGSMSTEVSPGRDTGMRVRLAPTAALWVSIYAGARLGPLRGGVEARFTLLETGFDLRAEADLSGNPITVCPSIGHFFNPILIEVFAVVETWVPFFGWELVLKHRFMEWATQPHTTGAWPNCLVESPKPQVVHRSFSTTEDSTLLGQLLGTDAERRKLLFWLDVDAYDRHKMRGTVVLVDHDEGTFSYTPDVDFSGEVSFGFFAHNGEKQSDMGTVRIVVRPDPDAPRAAAKSERADEDTDIALDLFAASSDVDGSEHCSFVISGVPDGFQLCFDAVCRPSREWFGSGFKDCSLLSRSDVVLRPARHAEWDAPLYLVVVSEELATGSATQTSVWFGVTLEAVNDPPSIDAPASLRVLEDSFVDFAVVIHDVDARGGTISVRLRVEHGRIWAPQDTFNSCDNDQPSMLDCSATLFQVNELFRQLRYEPDEDFVGADTLRIIVEDNGNSGKCPSYHNQLAFAAELPCSLSANAMTDLSVCAVNDPPVIHLPPTSDLTMVTTEGENPPLYFMVAVHDVDAATNASSGYLAEVKIELLGQSLGTISLEQASASGVEVCVDGECWRPSEVPSSEASIVFRGALPAVNEVLSSIRFDFDMKKAEACGQFVRITVNDLGSSGDCRSEPLMDAKTVSISVFKENLPPQIHIAENAFDGLTEGGVLALDSKIQVEDNDAGAGRLLTTLVCHRCSLVLNQCAPASGCRVEQHRRDGTWEAVISATVADLAFLLRNTSLLSDKFSSGSETSLLISVDDAGNSGFGGAKKDKAQVILRKTQVADRPELRVGTAFAVSGVGQDVALEIYAAVTDISEVLEVQIEMEENDGGEPLAIHCLWSQEDQTCRSAVRRTDEVGCFSLATSQAGATVTGQCDAILRLTVRASSTTPDGSQTAMREQRVTIHFVDRVAPKSMEPNGASISPWICTKKIVVSNSSLLSRCENSTLQVNMTLAKGVSLVVSDGMLRLMGSFQFTRLPMKQRNRTVIHFFRNDANDSPTRLRFVSNWSSPVSAASVNGVDWPGAALFNNSWQLARGFLEQQPGEPFPQFASVSILDAQCSSAPCDAQQLPVVQQLPSLANQRTTVIAISPTPSTTASSISFAILFDARNSSFGCCVERFGYAARAPTASQSFRPIESDDPIEVAIGLCSSTDQGCSRSPRGNTVRCRSAGVESIGVFDQVQGTVQCSTPLLTFESRDVYQHVFPEIAFGNGIWTSSGLNVTVYDVNHKPRIIGPSRLLVCNTGQDLALTSYYIQDQDFESGRFSDLSLSLRVVGGRGEVVQGGSTLDVADWVATYAEINQILQDGLVYRCPSVRGRDTVQLFIDDLGIAGLGGNLVDAFEISIAVAPSHSRPTVKLIQDSEHDPNATAVWSVYELDGLLDDDWEPLPDSRDSSTVTFQFCTVTNEELSDPLSFPCVLHVPHVQVVLEAGEQDQHTVFRVHVSSSNPASWLEVGEFAGLVDRGGSFSGSSFHFSGSLSEVNFALRGLSYRTFVEDSCVDVVSFRVEAAVPCLRLRSDGADHHLPGPLSSGPLDTDFSDADDCDEPKHWQLRFKNNELDGRAKTLSLSVDVGELHRLAVLEFDVPPLFDPSADFDPRAQYALEAELLPSRHSRPITPVVSVSQKADSFATVSLSIAPSTYTDDFADGAQFWTVFVTVAALRADSSSEVFQNLRWWYSESANEDQLLISVMPVNDAPEWLFETLRFEGLEDNDLALSGLRISDVDASARLEGVVEVSAAADAAHGSMAIDRSMTQHSADSATVVERSDGRPGSLVFLATVADSNQALATLHFRPKHNWNGRSSVILSVMDRANFGYLGQRRRTVRAEVVILAVNDAPILRVAPSLVMSEGGRHSFRHLTALSDPDSHESEHGQLHLIAEAEVGSLLMRCADQAPLPIPSKHHSCLGSAGQVALALQSLMYLADPDSGGADTISFTVSDLGNSGLGGARITKRNVSVTLRAVADKPFFVLDDSTSAGQCSSSQPRGWGWKYGGLYASSQRKGLTPDTTKLCSTTTALASGEHCPARLMFGPETVQGFSVRPEPLQRLRVFSFSRHSRLRFPPRHTAPFSKQAHAPPIVLAGVEDSAVCFDPFIQTTDSDGSESLHVNISSSNLSNVTFATNVRKVKGERIGFVLGALPETRAERKVFSLQFRRKASSGTNGTSGWHASVVPLWAHATHSAVILSHPGASAWSSPVARLTQQLRAFMGPDQHGTLWSTLTLVSQETNSDSVWIKHPIQLSFRPVDDELTIDAPTRLIAIEDTPLSVSGVILRDVDFLDFPKDEITVQLSASRGTLNLTADSNAFSVRINCSMATSCFLRGDMLGINSALRSLKYTSLPDFNGIDFLAIRAKVDAEEQTQVSQTVVEIETWAVNDPLRLRLANYSGNQSLVGTETWAAGPAAGFSAPLPEQPPSKRRAMSRIPHQLESAGLWDVLPVMEDSVLNLHVELVDADLPNSPGHEYTVSVIASHGILELNFTNVTYLAGDASCSLNMRFSNSTWMDNTPGANGNESDAGRSPWNETGLLWCASNVTFGEILRGRNIEFSGSFDKVNNAFRTLAYIPEQDFNGDDFVLIEIQDQDCCGFASSDKQMPARNETNISSTRFSALSAFDFLSANLKVAVSVLPVDDPPRLLEYSKPRYIRGLHEPFSTQWVDFSIEDPDGEPGLTVELSISARHGLVFFPNAQQARADCASIVVVDGPGGTLDWENHSLASAVRVRGPAQCFASLSSFGYVAGGLHADEITISVADVLHNVTSNSRSELVVAVCSCSLVGACVHAATQGGRACICESGWESNRSSCVNVDECSSDGNVCGDGGVCQDTEGSYLCSCADGWEQQGSGCINVNECDGSATVCAIDKVCQDTHGSFECHCADGWKDFGAGCVFMTPDPATTADHVSSTPAAGTGDTPSPSRLGQPSFRVQDLPGPNGHYLGFVRLLVTAGGGASHLNVSLGEVTPTCQAVGAALPVEVELLLSQTATVTAVSCLSAGASEVSAQSFVVEPGPRVVITVQLSGDVALENNSLAIQHDLLPVIADSLGVDQRRVVWLSGSRRRVPGLALQCEVLCSSPSEAQLLQRQASASLLSDLQLSLDRADSWSRLSVSAVATHIPSLSPPPKSSPRPDGEGTNIPVDPENTRRGNSIYVLVAAPVASVALLGCVSCFVWRRRCRAAQRVAPGDKPPASDPEQPECDAVGQTRGAGVTATATDEPTASDHEQPEQPESDTVGQTRGAGVTAAAFATVVVNPTASDPEQPECDDTRGAGVTAASAEEGGGAVIRRGTSLRPALPWASRDLPELPGASRDLPGAAAELEASSPGGSRAPAALPRRLPRLRTHALAKRQ